MTDEFDYVLVGGGLQNALIALSVLDRAPATRVALIEQAARLGGNHTWCFHAGDVPASIAAAIEPLVAHRWTAHEVRFPGFRRRICGGYAAITSARLDAVVTQALEAAGGRVLRGRAAREVARNRVVLDDGDSIAAQFVVDARGPGSAPPPAGAGFQIFLGHEVELERPHGLVDPIVMDAEVEQVGGFHFMYALPLAADRLLVEDTYFTDEPRLDESALARRIDAWIGDRGLGAYRVVRAERGVLPMPWTAGPAPRPTWPLRAGYQGGFFHPATGYSFPVAARLAAVIAAAPATGGGAALVSLCRQLVEQQRYARALNRLAFRWFAPAERWHIFARFYRMPEATIGRFYALELTRADQARILLGSPPHGFSLRARLAHGTDSARATRLSARGTS